MLLPLRTFLSQSTSHKGRTRKKLKIYDSRRQRNDENLSTLFCGLIRRYNSTRYPGFFLHFFLSHDECKHTSSYLSLCCPTSTHRYKFTKTKKRSVKERTAVIHAAAAFMLLRRPSQSLKCLACCRALSTASTSHRNRSALCTHSDAVFQQFVSQVMAAPHRDVTHIAYGDWLALYIRGLKSVNQASSTLSHATANNTVTTLEAVRQQINAMLLGSIFAKHWTQVTVPSIVRHSAVKEEEKVDHLGPKPTQSSGDTQPSTYKWSAHPSPLELLSTATTSLDSNPLHLKAVNVSSFEVFTSDFLTEPSLGGNYIRRWADTIHVAASGSRNSAFDPDMGTNRSLLSSNPVNYIILPFSTLWEIKMSAFSRPSPSSTSSSDTGTGNNTMMQSFSMQERQARQVLLQSIDQLLQLQQDAWATALPQPPATPLPMAVVVLPPTMEWDMLCQLPTFRRSLSAALSPSSSSPTTPSWLSMSALCESYTARLAYFTHRMVWEQQQQRNPPTPVHLVAHVSEHRRFRDLQVPRIRAQSGFSDALGTASHGSASGPRQMSLQSSSGRSVHEKAVKGCSDAVRRMTVREENIRQVFSLR